jgi:hypothetical protein
MTALIDSNLRNPAGVVHNENAVSLEARLPSPQLGRGVGGEGDRRAVLGRSPFRTQLASPAFTAQSLVRATPPHPQPLSRVGERGAEFSLQSLRQKRPCLAKCQKLPTRILVASLWMLLFAPSPVALAQAKKTDKPAEQPGSGKPQPAVEAQPQAQKVFAIKHADVDAIARTLRIFGVALEPNRELRVIGVRAPAALMSTIEETIRRLDVPAPPAQNVELTVYLLLASDQESGLGSLPPDLESVVKQLKTTFAFKGFRAVDTLVLRSRDRQWADVRGLAKLDPDIPNPSTYSLSHRGASILSDEKGRSIRLDDLRFKAQIGVKKQQEQGSAVIAYDMIEAGFGTNVDVREGQKVVVGKAAVGGTNAALVLVITAKILE